jgi:hypothetical protein
MLIEISNGFLAPAMVTTSWLRADYANGRRHYKLYGMQVPLMPHSPRDPPVGVSHPNLAGSPIMIGEASLEVRASKWRRFCTPRWVRCSLSNRRKFSR